jgi:geranylgeranyl pyrophosphate synthase
MPAQLETALEEGLRCVEAELAAVGQRARPLLREVIRHQLAGGKQLRPRMALLVGQLIAARTSEGLARFAAVTEVVQAASLVQDDILDRGTIRHGQASVNAQWGTRVALLLSDYLFAQAALITAQLNRPPLMQLLAETIQILVQGELQQMEESFDLAASAAGYQARIAAKCASHFVLAAEGAALYAGATGEQIAAVRRYAHQLGLAYQIVDDVLDYTGDSVEIGKPVGTDLANGILTLPAIYYLTALPADAPDRRRVAERRELDQVVAAVRRSTAPTRALAHAHTLIEEAIGALATFPPSAAREGLVALAHLTVRRRA